MVGERGNFVAADLGDPKSQIPHWTSDTGDPPLKWNRRSGTIDIGHGNDGYYAQYHQCQYPCRSSCSDHATARIESKLDGAMSVVTISSGCRYSDEADCAATAGCGNRAVTRLGGDWVFSSQSG